MPLDAWKLYYRLRAQPWERLALTRARVVFAQGEFGREVAAAIREVLAVPVDPAELASAVVAMRRKLEDSRAPGDLKRGVGGQVDVEFIVQYLQLVHAAETPRTAPAQRLGRDRGAAEGRDPGPGGRRRTEGRLRQPPDHRGSRPDRPESRRDQRLRRPDAALARLARRLNYDDPDESAAVVAFRADLARYSARVRDLFAQLVAAPAGRLRCPTRPSREGTEPPDGVSLGPAPAEASASSPGVAIALGLLALAIRIEPRARWPRSSAAGPTSGWSPAAFGLYLAGLVVSFGRWWIFVRAGGLPLKVRDAFRLGFIGALFNFILPGAIVGIFVRAAFLCREHPERKGPAIASSFLDLIVGLLGLSLWACLSGVRSWSTLEVPGRRMVAVAFVLAAAFSGLLVAAFTPACIDVWERKAEAVGSVLLDFSASYPSPDRRIAVVSTLCRSAILLGMGTHGLYVLAFMAAGRCVLPGHPVGGRAFPDRPARPLQHGDPPAVRRPRGDRADQHVPLPPRRLSGRRRGDDGVSSPPGRRRLDRPGRLPRESRRRSGRSGPRPSRSSPRSRHAGCPLIVSSDPSEPGAGAEPMAEPFAVPNASAKRPTWKSVVKKHAAAAPPRGARRPDGPPDREGRVPRLPGRRLRPRRHRHAFPDIELVHFGEQSAGVRDITAASTLPVLVDIDEGYGNVKNVFRTVRTYENMGVSAIFMEDQPSPTRCGHMPGKSVVPIESFAAKVRAAVGARTNPDFFLIARTDAIAVNGLDDALKRAEVSIKNGADGIFIEGVETVEQFEKIGEKFREVPKIANMFEGGGVSPVLKPSELHEMGFQMILYPTSLLFRVAFTLRKALEDMKAERLKFEGEGMDFKSYEAVLGLPEWKKLEDRFGRGED